MLRQIQQGKIYMFYYFCSKDDDVTRVCSGDWRERGVPTGLGGIVLILEQTAQVSRMSSILRIQFSVMSSKGGNF